MEMAFTELCSWFDGFLKARHQRTGVDEKGMIFLDESTYETSLRQITHDFPAERVDHRQRAVHRRRATFRQVEGSLLGTDKIVR